MADVRKTPVTSCTPSSAAMRTASRAGNERAASRVMVTSTDCVAACKPDRNVCTTLGTEALVPMTTVTASVMASVVSVERSRRAARFRQARLYNERIRHRDPHLALLPALTELDPYTATCGSDGSARNTPR